MGGLRNEITCETFTVNVTLACELKARCFHSILCGHKEMFLHTFAFASDLWGPFLWKNK